MIEQNILNILIHKIKDKCINPNTNKEYIIEDIKIQEYKDELTKILTNENVIINDTNNPIVMKTIKKKKS